MELRGFEPLTFCMPCRRATSCAIAPCASPREQARDVNVDSIPVPRPCVVPTSARARPPAPARRHHVTTLTQVTTPGSTRAPDPHLATPAGKPRARALGLNYQGTPGPYNAITDVPGVEVGYTTLIEGDNVRTGVTAIHPRGKGNPGDPVAAGYHSQNGNGEMTGVSWIEESGTLPDR